MARDILAEHRAGLETTSEILLKRETIEAAEFFALLDGKSEAEVFGPDEELPAGTQERPELPGTVTRDRESAPRGYPRPGLAGGAAEFRSLDRPEKPDLA